MTNDQIQIDILEKSLRAISTHYDELVRACVDSNGKPVAPTAQDIGKARGYLPPYCSMAYKKSTS